MMSRFCFINKGWQNDNLLIQISIIWIPLRSIFPQVRSIIGNMP